VHHGAGRGVRHVRAGGSLWLTLLALAVAGAADAGTVVLSGIIVQTVTPDEFRGRVNAADYMVGVGGGRLGSLEAGAVGSLTSPVTSALSGGLVTVLGAVVIGATLPAFRRYRFTASAAETAAEAAGEAAGEARWGGREPARVRNRASGRCRTVC
jgi:hypothetical protein